MSRVSDETIEYVENKKKTPISEHLECPWIGFYDPLWLAVRNLLDLKEDAGYSITEMTDTIVHQAYLYYSKESRKIDGYVMNKDYQKRKDELKKRK